MTTHKSPPAPTLARDTANRRRNQPRRWDDAPGAFVRELLIVVVGAVVVSSLLRAFVGQMFIIPSQSMENTLLVGDRVVVREAHRASIAVTWSSSPTQAVGWRRIPLIRGPWDKALEFIGLPDQEHPGHLIKRVIGMPGDKVVCCTSKGRITVNGYPLDEASYLYTDPDDEPESTRPMSRFESRGAQGPDLRDG